MARPRVLSLVALVALAAALAGCGSRRPMADFLASSGGVDRGVSGTSGAGGDLGTGIGPDGAAGNAAGTAAGALGGAGSAGSAALNVAGAAGSNARQSAAGAGGGAGSAGGAAAGGASDVGVTATTITIGNVVTKSGSFGPDQFTPFYYGAAAYFAQLNAQGGINGRRVVFRTCDDAGSDSGDQNCARKLIDDTKVFSFVGNNCLSCAGMNYVSSKGVPSVGGFTIDSRGYALPHFYVYLGDPYPQNGSIGYKGKLYLPLGQFEFLKEKYGITKAGVVYYDNSKPSQNAGLAYAAALEMAGISVTKYPENVALPQFDSAVLDMKSRGIKAVWDSIDITGNQNLCRSIDSNGLVLTAKVSTISTWSQSVASQFSAPCRNYMFSVEDPGSLAYSDVSNPEVAKFRAAMKRYFPDREDRLYQWTLDGWASAMWFADAAKSCGAALTRACLETFLNKPGGYGAHGLWSPRGNDKIDFEHSQAHRCITVVQWQDSAQTWVTRARFQCYTTPWSGWAAPS